MTLEEKVVILQGEMERRPVIFLKNTTMIDDTVLNYDDDPNNIVEMGPDEGQNLIYGSPQFTLYGQTDGTIWIKEATPNIWRRYDEFDTVTIRTTTKKPLSIKSEAKNYMVDNLNVEYLGGKKQEDLVPRNFMSIAPSRVYTKARTTVTKENSHIFVYNNEDGEAEKVSISKIHRPSSYILNSANDLNGEILIDDFIYHKLEEE
jgi:hypothetical protein